MKYLNTSNVKSIEGIEIEGNSLWIFNPHRNLMILTNNHNITSKPNVVFQRVR